MNEANRLLSHLWRGGEWGYFWTSQGKLSRWFRTSDPLPHLTGGKNYYFGVHPTATLPHDAMHRRSTGQTVSAVNTLFGEFDAKDFNDSLSDTLAHIHSLSRQPSVIIFSGGGYHCYWLLRETFAITDERRRNWIDRIQKGWVSYIQSDKGAKDLARVLRIVGTRNYKPKYAPNFPLVTLIKADYERRYTLDDFDTYAVKERQRQRTPLVLPFGAQTNLPPFTRNYLEYGAPEGKRSMHLFAAAIDYRANGYTLSDAERDLGGRARLDGLTDLEIERILRSGWASKHGSPNIAPSITTRLRGLRGES